MRQDGRVHLTVVYFGNEQMSEVRSTLENMSRWVGNAASVKSVHLSQTRKHSLEEEANSATVVHLFQEAHDAKIPSMLPQTQQFHISQPVYFPLDTHTHTH